MLGLILTLSVVLVAQAQAVEVALPDGPNPASPDYLQKSCLASLRANDCAGFFKANPALAKYADDCSSKGNYLGDVKSCGLGGYEAGKDIARFIIGAPVALWNASKKTPERNAEIKFFNNCAASMDCKLSLWHEVHGQSPNDDVKKRLQQVTSGTALEVGVKTESRRVQMEQSESVRSILLSEPDSDERDAKIEKLIPGWTERKMAHGKSLYDVGLSAANGLLKRAACYNSAVKTEAVCYGLATILIPGTVAKVLTKMPRLAAIRAAASGKEIQGAVIPITPGMKAEEMIAVNVSQPERPITKVVTNNHYSIETENVRLDPQVIGLNKVSPASTKYSPVKIQIGADPKLRSELVKQLTAMDGRKAWSCLDGVCNALEEVGFKIPGYSNRPTALSSYPKIVEALKSGNITFKGEALPAGSVRLVTESPQELEHFLATYSADKRNFIVIAAGNAGAYGGAAMIIYELKK